MDCQPVVGEFIVSKAEVSSGEKEKEGIDPELQEGGKAKSSIDKRNLWFGAR